MTHRTSGAALGLAAVLAGGCAGIPENFKPLEQARAAYRTAQTDPQVASRAPIELNQAERALNEAEALRRSGADESVVAHHAYLAEQRARIASQVGELRTAEAAIATANETRNKVLLEARERERKRSAGSAATHRR